MCVRGWHAHAEKEEEEGDFSEGAFSKLESFIISGG